MGFYGLRSIGHESDPQVEHQERVKKGRLAMRYWIYGHASDDVEPPDHESSMKCPVCGAELGWGDKLYFDVGGNLAGCDECITTKYAEDYLGD